MAGRFANSWALIKSSAAVLNEDRELLVFPLLSSIAAIVIFVSFAPLFAEAPETSRDEYYLLVAGGLYLAEYFVIFFFNSALVGAAMIRLAGGDPGIGDGLRVAWSKFWQILGYAMIAATVGVLLRAIGERFGFVGRMIAGLTGVVWTVATFLVVPVLVTRDIGPIDAVRESGALLRKTWGENLISNAGIGAVFYLVYFLLFGLFAALAWVAASADQPALALGIGAAGLLAMIIAGLFQAALQGVTSAALYLYATEGAGSGDLTPQILGRAFAPK